MNSNVFFRIQCSCKREYGGRQCDECSPGFYNYPECSRKSNSLTIIKISFSKFELNSPLPDSHRLALWISLACGCNKIGSRGESCDQNDGKCRCRSNFEGDKCDKCIPDR